MIRSGGFVAVRRGVASLIAMLYLMLFASLAVGFYSSVNTAVQVSHNEQDAFHSQMAAESGMDFVRYHLHQMVIPPLKTDAALLSEVLTDLKTQLDGTPNLQGKTLAINGSHLRIPSNASDYITLPDGSSFHAVITTVGNRVKVKTYGRHGTITEADRGIQLDYTTEEHYSPVFEFGLATKSRITMNSNSAILGIPASRASVLSTATVTPILTMLSNAQISGDVSFTSTAAAALSQKDNTKIAGLLPGDPGVVAHVHPGVAAPEFPTPDTSIYEPFATNIISIPGTKIDAGTVRNVRIKAGVNPIFDGSTLVQGVIYIETPNMVTFNSNARIEGIIAVQNNPTGNPTTNTITFDSNTTIKGVEVLDPAIFGDLTKLGGACILAPTFNVRFNSNFGVAGGSIIASKFHFDSNANGTIEGSVICLNNTAVVFDGNSGVTIKPPLSGGNPNGVRFSARYIPDRRSYIELTGN